jgi:hypothetical protein
MRTKITVPGLAREWGVGCKKILGFINSGELRAIDVSTHRAQRPRYLIDRADIERFEAARTVAPDAGCKPLRLRRPTSSAVKEFV